MEGTTMDNRKKFGRGKLLAFLVALILITAQFVSVCSAKAGAAAAGYEGIGNADKDLDLPASLKDGEVWTGKAVRHNEDGTITVTLAAWGKIIPPTSGGDPIKPLGGDQYVTVFDGLGDFKVKGALPTGVEEGGDNTVVWRVHQDFILGGEAATVSYDLELADDEVDWRTDYWYTTGTATCSFTPVEGNPLYWTKTETTYDSFIISMNWNNGSGLNSGLIIDRILDITFVFGKNSSKENENPYSANANWDKLIIEGKVYEWHLIWSKGGSTKSFYFTIKDPAGLGADIVYEINFDSPGGNASQASGRTLTSENYFHRSFEEGDPEHPFVWNGDAIVIEHDVVSQIRFEPEPQHTGSLTIGKMLEDNFMDWGVDGETQFIAVVQDKETGDYLTFETLEDGPAHHYTYTGTGAVGSELIFTASASSTIYDIPADMICIVIEALDADYVDITYSLGEAAIVRGQDTPLTVTNTYDHRMGDMVVTKLYDGFPSDWGLNDSTVFLIKVWDIEHGNYLIFKRNYRKYGG
jgi:hypothetical protein